jgi:hypothetical protein
MYQIFLRGDDVIKLMVEKINNYMQELGITVVNDSTLRKEPIKFI